MIGLYLLSLLQKDCTRHLVETHIVSTEDKSIVDMIEELFKNSGQTYLQM